MDTSGQSASGEQPAPASRPRAIRLALALLWASLALYALLVGNEAVQGANSGLLAWLIPLVTVALVTVLIGFVGRGANAARWIYAVLFVLGSLPLALDPDAVLARSPMIGGANIVMFVLQLAAVILLFSRAGASWFRRPAQNDQ